MKVFLEKSRLIPLVLLLLLMGVGVHTSFDSNGYGEWVDESIYFMFALLLPLVVIMLTLLFSQRKRSPLVSAYIALIFGYFGEFSYYALGGGESIETLFLGINLIAYWIAGFIAFISLITGLS